jgi:hypothetical protein
MNRRDFLALAVSAPIAAQLPSFASAAPPAPEVAPAPEKPAAPVFFFDALPISGLAGECSGRY